MSPQHVDVIIVGSGPAGVHAAYPLVMAGKTVAMLDGGLPAPALLAQAPEATFEQMRHARADQYRWFLGDDFSGIPLQGLSGGQGPLLTGNRAYVVRDANRLLPFEAEHVQIVQSLAQGGLGAAWGATCAFLSPEELRLMGLPVEEMDRHYQHLIERIGISGPQDRPGVQPPLRLDHHAEALWQAYQRRQSRFDADGISIAPPHMAVLTRDLDGRRACAYTDMEYFADPQRAVYRPHYTLEELQRHPNFSYLGHQKVETVAEQAADAVVAARAIHAGQLGETSRFTARRIILAAGAIGTARILLSSFGWFGRALPLIAKPHTYTVCLHPRVLGHAGPAARTSFCQLILRDQATADGASGACAQLYSYRSFQLFRLVRDVPLPLPEALSLLALLTPALVIADLRLASPLCASESRVSLEKNPGGAAGQETRLAIRGSVPSVSRVTRHAPAFRRLHRALRALGLLPLRTTAHPEGSSSHYAGTVPCSAAPTEWPLSTDVQGKLHQGRRIYVADASTFRYLPALPHTLTLMANADRIGTHVLHTLDAV